MKRIIVVLAGLLVVLICSLCSADQWTPEQRQILKSIKTIMLKVDSESWYTKNPFDIGKYVTDQLKRNGYIVVTDKNFPCDAEIEVDYNESSSSFEGITPDWALGTSIDCNVTLRHPVLGNVLWLTIEEGSIQHASGYVKGYHQNKAEHYRNANSDFKSSFQLKYLGRIIKSYLGAGTEDMVDILIDAMKDKDGYTRIEAIREAWNHQDPRLVIPLIEALKKGNVSVCLSLGQFGDQRAVAPLTEGLSRKNPNERSQVVRALGTLASRGFDCSQAVMPILKLLDEPDWSLRNDVVFVLETSCIGDERAIEPLKATALKYPDMTSTIYAAIKDIQNRLSKKVGSSAIVSEEER